MTKVKQKNRVKTDIEIAFDRLIDGKYSDLTDNWIAMETKCHLPVEESLKWFNETLAPTLYYVLAEPLEPVHVDTVILGKIIKLWDAYNRTRWMDEKHEQYKRMFYTLVTRN